MNSLRLVNWNVEWASSRSQRGQIIRQVIQSLEPDVVCITEGYVDFLPDFGHLITSEADYGYPSKAGRRKVLLWSKFPWRDVSATKGSEMPPGRYVDGVTQTPLGEVRIMGMCIPWRHAHVNTGHRNRVVWEDHRRYLSGLQKRIAKLSARPLVMTGDFNQRIPPAYIPADVSRALLQLIQENALTVITPGPVPPTNHPTLDHIVISNDLISMNVWALPATSSTGRHLSDHEGIVADIEKPSTTSSLKG